MKTNFIENTKLKEKMMNQDYMSKLVARALDEEFTEELTEELNEVKSTIEYKAKLPFKGARWVPLPREFSGKPSIDFQVSVFCSIINVIFLYILYLRKVRMIIILFKIFSEFCGISPAGLSFP